MLDALQATLTVADLARDSGVNPSTVRFYDDQGLITATRTAGNQRRFCPDDSCRVKVIRVAQRIGLSVSEIRALFDSLPTDSTPTPADWALVSQSLKDEAQIRISQLHAALDDLAAEDKVCMVATA
jgi:MerR family redox-sensitive transcriptional activator SoxR